jgi:hypothetical protein
MNLDFHPISSVQHADDMLGIAELIAFFQGECFIDDLDWDEDQLLQSFLETVDDQATRADYEAEPATGIQLAKDTAVRAIQELIENRHGGLGSSSPFTWDFGSELLLRRKDVIPAVGLAYIWLSAFWMLRSSNSYLVVTPDARAFFRAFEEVFEATCAFVLAGRRESAIWYLGSSRSAQELVRRLGSFVHFCGTGQAKAYAQLTARQRRSNDGGVDILAVTTAGGTVTIDSEIYLLGATIQSSQRRSKIIGANQIARFRNYFGQHPHLPMWGVFAVPFAYSALDAELCGEQNCVYISREAVLGHLGRHGPFARGLRGASAKILAKTKQLSRTVTFRN